MFIFSYYYIYLTICFINLALGHDINNQMFLFLVSELEYQTKMAVFGLASAVAGFVKVRYLIDKAVIDNMVFRMHYRITSAIMFLCCILVTANNLIGKSFDCKILVLYIFYHFSSISQMSFQYINRVFQQNICVIHSILQLVKIKLKINANHF